MPPHSTSAVHPPRVVVTGIGLWTGLGGDRESTWQGLRSGRSAMQRLEPEWTGTDRPEIGCPLGDVEPAHRGEDPVLTVIRRATDEALADAALRFGSAASEADPERTATLLGLSKGCIGNLRRLALARHDPTEKARLESIPWFWERLCWPNAGAALVAAAYGLCGPCVAPVAACATGLVAVLQGTDLIRRGACDIALAGAADASLDPMLLAAFRRMGVLAHGGGDPARTVRPWDRARSGFVVGEGGAVVVLEREEAARARGVLPYAEVAGGALGADAFHETNLNPDPAGLAALIGRALANAGVSPREIDHVNVHGTATRINDPLECRAIRLALGEAADRVACSANKAQIGHLLGAAGAAELAITCLAIRDGFVPPTRNLDDPDPACDLDGTPHVGRARAIGTALKLSIGFGGHLAAAVLRRPEGPRRQS